MRHGFPESHGEPRGDVGFAAGSDRLDLPLEPFPDPGPVQLYRGDEHPGCIIENNQRNKIFFPDGFQKNSQRLLYPIQFVGLTHRSAFVHNEHEIHRRQILKEMAFPLKADAEDLVLTLCGKLLVARINGYPELTFRIGIVVVKGADKVLDSDLVKGNDLPRRNNPAYVSYNFRARLYHISADFQQLEQLKPVSPKSDTYALYTRRSGRYIVPGNPKIRKISGKLWEESSDLLDYAKKCYLYVADSFTYLNPNTGIHPLAKLLRDGGGDCGNLSTIFISLLRCKGIPARHLVAKRPDGSNHVWVDFHRQDYGWIPVDVSKRNANKYGDFFGKIDSRDAGIIVSKGVNLTVEKKSGEKYRTILLQNFDYWYWYSSGTGDVLVDFRYITKFLN